MFLRGAKLGVFALFFSVAFATEKKFSFYETLNSADLWCVEQMPGGHVEITNGRMLITDGKGCTVWFRPKLTAPVSIQYDAVVRSRGRVSDLNCFWMASDPVHPEQLFPGVPPRGGAFAEYDRLQLYYVGYGGNSNSTTRFRRYEGNGNKPLLPEYDLRTKPFLLEPDHVYHIALTAHDGVAQFLRDGEVVFTFRDPRPLETGWFGIRTVGAQIEVTDVRINSSDTPSTVTKK